MRTVGSILHRLNRWKSKKRTAVGAGVIQGGIEHGNDSKTQPYSNEL